MTPPQMLGELTATPFRVGDPFALHRPCAAPAGMRRVTCAYTSDCGVRARNACLQAHQSAATLGHRPDHSRSKPPTVHPWSSGLARHRVELSMPSRMIMSKRPDCTIVSLSLGCSVDHHNADFPRTANARRLLPHSNHPGHLPPQASTP